MRSTALFWPNEFRSPASSLRRNSQLVLRCTLGSRSRAEPLPVGFGPIIGKKIGTVKRLATAELTLLSKEARRNYARKAFNLNLYIFNLYQRIFICVVANSLHSLGLAQFATGGVDAFICVRQQRLDPFCVM